MAQFENPNANESSIAASKLGEYYTLIRIGKYKRPSPFEAAEFEATKFVYLPIPQELMDKTGSRYDNMNLETVGDLMNMNIASGIGAAALRYSGKGVSSVLSKGVGALMGAAVEKLTGAESSGSTGAAAMSELFPPDQITSVIQQSVGKAPNPNPSVQFLGPEMRDFNHSWTFYPRDENESKNVNKLIKTLKSACLPENTVSGATALLNYPDMCQINFFPWDKGGSGPYHWSENSIIKYKKCMMRNVSVNYTPANSPGFFHDTKMPVGVQLSISFVELEYMMAKDWDSSRAGTSWSELLNTDTLIGGLTGAAVGGVPGAFLGSQLFNSDAVTAEINELFKSVL